MIVFGIGAALGGPVSGRFTDSRIGWPAAFLVVVSVTRQIGQTDDLATAIACIRRNCIFTPAGPAYRPYTQESPFGSGSF
jgi:hypothetical protein